jgi:hypothetical protein
MDAVFSTIVLGKTHARLQCYLRICGDRMLYLIEETGTCWTQNLTILQLERVMWHKFNSDPLIMAMNYQLTKEFDDDTRGTNTALIARGNYLFHEDNDVVTRSYLNFQDY